MNVEVKTSISISPDLLEDIKAAAREQKRNISEIVENGMRDYLKKLMREKHDAREIEILNRIAEEQHEEILENLEYQADIWNEEIFTELINQRD